MAAAEISLERLREVFDRSRYLAPLNEIVLTGGEPFLRKDFKDLYRYFRERFPRARITVITNGLLIKSDFLVTEQDVGSTVLVFSLDGLEKTNDLVRGIGGSFKRVLAAVEFYRSHFPILKMGLSFTIMPDNFQDLRAVYEIARKLGIGFTMRFAGSSATFYGPPEHQLLWQEEILDRIEEDVRWVVRDLSRSRNWLNRWLNPDLTFFSKMVAYQRHPQRLVRCFAGTDSAFIDAYGNVYPCIFIGTALGNLKDSDFDDIWLSEGAAAQRRLIAAEKCHCWTECETLPALQRRLAHLALKGKK